MGVQLCCSFLIAAATLLLSGCHYQLPPVQPVGHSFSKAQNLVLPHRRLNYAKAELFYQKEMLDLWEVPKRNKVLIRVVAEGKLRFPNSVRVAAMEVLAARQVQKAIPVIVHWRDERRGMNLLHSDALCRINPRKFPPEALLDGLRTGYFSGTDSLTIAWKMARLGNPSQFAYVQNKLQKADFISTIEAIDKLWYFWPFQGNVLPSGDTIDLFPILETALHDSSVHVFQRALIQCEYAPKHPLLKQHLEEYLAETKDEFRRYACLKVLVYRYHRKEKGFPRDIRSYWSRRKRTFME
jgi:hypothetical protein